MVKTVKCSNCGRERAPSEPIPYVQLTQSSLLGLRALFTGQFLRAECPANCGGTLDFEPSVMFHGNQPPVSFLSGGDAVDALDAEHIVSHMLEELRREHPGADVQLDARSFTRQEQLAQAVYAYLRKAAGAMSALNVANKKGDFLEFMMREWRTITPQTLVASDAVTLVERVTRAESPEARNKAVEYFSVHAAQLARIRALGWTGMCTARSSQRTQPKTTFASDLAAYVEKGAIFTESPARFAECAKPFLTAEKRDPLVVYCLLGALARVHRDVRTQNPFETEWTVAWMEIELASLEDAESLAIIAPLLLDNDDIAGTIVRRALFDAVGHKLAPLLGSEREAFSLAVGNLNSVAEKAGYAGLVTDVLRRGIKITPFPWPTVDAAMSQMRDMVQRGVVATKADDERMGLRDAARFLTTALLEARDQVGLTTVFDQTRAMADDDATRAEVESWFGATLLLLNQEQRFIDYVGWEERPWEAALADDVKAPLWTERANALRALGRSKEALEWRERVVPLYASNRESENYRTAVRGVAIAYREMGAPDRALEIIVPLLEDTKALDRIHMLDTAAATWAALGELEKARVAYDEGIALAVGPDARLLPHFVAGRAALGAGLRSGSELEQSLMATPKEAWSDPTVLLQECAAWANMHIMEHEFGEQAGARYGEAVRTLGAALNREDNWISPSLRESAYLAMAVIAELTDESKAPAFWSAAADAADALGQTPGPSVVLALSADRYKDGDVKGGRAILAALPAALARSVERLKHIDIALDAFSTLEPRFNALIQFLLEQQLGHDARVVAEFRRDPLRRSTSPRYAEVESKDFLAGKSFSRVLSGNDVAVLEFLEGKGGLAAMLTWRPPGGRVQFTLMEWPDVDMDDVRERLLYKLQVWVRGRPGDPFAVQGWAEFRGWIRAKLDEVLPPDGHLVVIEHEMLAGIPFHVAVAPERSCSYTSSWAALLGAVDGAPEGMSSLGVAMVPAFSDAPTVPETMHSVRTGFQTLAAKRGLAYAEAIDAQCDRVALTELLRTSDVAFVACHGFLDEQRKEVAWVLAHNGGLPGRSGSLVEGDGERVTHVGWRELETLEKTPRLVISAACSSGRALLTGLGERLGIFPSLAERGTRTLIAPGWDVDADLVLPVAARALELCVDGSAAPAAAVRQACREASERLPAWIAWALSVEGAWQ